MDLGSKKLYVWLQRHRRDLFALGYTFIIVACLLVIWDPNYLAAALPFLVEDTPPVRLISTSTRAPVTLRKSIFFDFVPQDFPCEDMFHLSGHGFQYPESYWDHVDAYKGVLQMSDQIHEGSANEQSWILTEIGALAFVHNVCVVGFQAGHNVFHFLVAQEDSVVYSFDENEQPNSIDIQDFMAIEFPDRFLGYLGDPKVTVPQWVQKNANKTWCDVLLFDTSKDADTLRSVMTSLQQATNPYENIVIFDSHPQNNSAAAELWQGMVQQKVINEHFRCYIKQFDDSGAATNQRGLMVGSFIRK